MIRWAALAVVALVCTLGLTACGGGESTSSTGTSSNAPASTASSDSEKGEASSEPSAEFAGKGENGVLATAGKESSVAERSAASKVVEESLKARAARNWAAQCQTLARSVVKQVEGSSSGGFFTQSCTEGLETVAGRATPATLENTMIEPLAALRVNGKRAFGFYHGAAGVDYVIPLEKEGGEWKVASLVAQETP